MKASGIYVPEETDGEGAQRVRDLSVGGEAESGEVIDHVADEGENDHHWHLLPLALVDDDKAEGERRDEYEGIPHRLHRIAASHRRCGIFVDPSVK